MTRRWVLAVGLPGVAMSAAGQHGPGGPGGGRGRGPGPRLDGKWWTDPRWVQRLGLSGEQQTRMEAVFQQHRLRLIDLRAALDKQEAMLEPLISAERPQEARVLEQIDRVADARADLEKANAKMLWGFRQVLTPEQWRILQMPDAGRGMGRGERE